MNLLITIRSLWKVCIYMHADFILYMVGKHFTQTPRGKTYQSQYLIRWEVVVEWHTYERERERGQNAGWWDRRGERLKKKRSPPVRSVWRHSKITTKHPFVASSTLLSMANFHSLPPFTITSLWFPPFPPRVKLYANSHLLFTILSLCPSFSEWK